MSNFFSGFTGTTGALVAIAAFVFLCCCALAMGGSLLDPTVQNVMDNIIIPTP